MKQIPLYLSILFLLAGCSSSKLVNEWKSPDSFNFEANKVLVVGITPDTELRRDFEKRVSAALDKKGVIAVESVSFFEKSFTNNEQSEIQLDAIEQQLISAGFDAVLFARVTGQESRVSLAQSYRNIRTSADSFKDYYYTNQHLYTKEENQQYQVYHTETSIYCICPGKERELLWQGEIEVVDAERPQKNIDDYVRILMTTLEERHLLIINL